MVNILNWIKPIAIMYAVAVLSYSCTTTRYISVDKQTGDTTYYQRQYDYWQGGYNYNPYYYNSWYSPYYYNHYRPHQYVPVYIYKQPTKPVVQPDRRIERQVTPQQPTRRPIEQPSSRR